MRPTCFFFRVVLPDRAPSTRSRQIEPATERASPRSGKRGRAPQLGVGEQRGRDGTPGDGRAGVPGDKTRHTGGVVASKRTLRDPAPRMCVRVLCVFLGYTAFSLPEASGFPVACVVFLLGGIWEVPLLGLNRICWWGTGSGRFHGALVFAVLRNFCLTRRVFHLRDGFFVGRGGGSSHIALCHVI